MDCRRVVEGCLVAMSLAVTGCGGSESTGPDGLTYRQRVEAAQQEADPQLRAQALSVIGTEQSKAEDQQDRRCDDNPAECEERAEVDALWQEHRAPLVKRGDFVDRHQDEDHC